MEEARRELQKLEERAKNAGRSGLVVIVDSLEKLRGVSTNWVEVLDSAERLFSGGAPYLQLPVSVIYTVPPSLVSRQVDSVFFMPMIKLHDRADSRYEEGFAAARELVRRRNSDTEL